MSYNLDRFIEAQERDFNTALSEIKSGRKETHWMWYIFPQIKGLGHSSTSEFYGIKSLDEAKTYWENDYLRNNLLTITGELLKINKSAIEIFGYTDAIKLKSCMTLFALATNEKLFLKIIEKFFSGNRDAATLKIVNS